MDIIFSFFEQVYLIFGFLGYVIYALFTGGSLP